MLRTQTSWTTYVTRLLRSSLTWHPLSRERSSERGVLGKYAVRRVCKWCLRRRTYVCPCVAMEVGVPYIVPNDLGRRPGGGCRVYDAYRVDTAARLQRGQGQTNRPVLASQLPGCKV
jgi:hypothetical protein